MLTIEREKEIREALDRSTKVVAWYPHPREVRGPFCRWFTCSEASNGMGDPINYPVPVAKIEDDVKYCAIAMNSVPELLAEIDRLRNANNQLGKIVTHWMEESFKWHIGDMENRRKLDLAVKAISNFLNTVSLDWYVDQYRKDEKVNVCNSGVIQKIYNMELIERNKTAFYNLNETLKQIRGEG